MSTSLLKKRLMRVLEMSQSPLTLMQPMAVKWTGSKQGKEPIKGTIHWLRE